MKNRRPLVQNSERKPRIAFLVIQLGKGYGVSVVAEAQARYLVKHGWSVDFYCLDSELIPEDRDIQIFQVPRSFFGLRWKLESEGYSAVIAHTIPFHQFLPSVQGVKTIIWEHGEPRAELFPGEEGFRRSLSSGKLKSVYPFVNVVVAISDFIRNEIGWPQAVVVYNGSDHMWRSQNITVKSSASKSRPLSILMVSRMWKSERSYKGIDDLIELSNHLGAKAVITLAGRGGESDAEYLRSMGLKVCLNISDSELCELYSNADLVVSLSKWEGFNLPLVEAGFFGKPAYALNVGAHSEVTPFVFDTLGAMEEKIMASSLNSLAQEGEEMREFVQRFSWKVHGESLSQIIGSQKATFNLRFIKKIQNGVLHLIWSVMIAARKFGKYVFGCLRWLRGLVK